MYGYGYGYNLARQSGASEDTFHPLDLAGTQLYFAKNTATPSLWNDQSPNGFDLSQAVATKQPIISANSVDFDGVNDILFNTTVSPFIADSEGILFFSAYVTSGVISRIFTVSQATGTTTGASTLGIFYNGSKIRFNLRNSSFSVRNDFSTDDTFGTGYIYGYLKRIVGGQELWVNGSLRAITYTFNLTPGSWFSNVGATNRISLGGIFSSSLVFYTPSRINKIYYNNTNLSPTNLTKLDTFFSDPNNY